jgi:16S rRNA (guanine966-N2)-methyltransferase
MPIAENGRHNARHVTTRPPALPMNRRPTRAPSIRPPGVVRIIGGDWRGTRLPVADRDGLRPTSDRVRETLFNWLQPMLPGARVLDLFAGSGALGLEAVSRGAHEAVLVERDPQLAESLRQLATKLPGGERVQVVCADALVWLGAAPGDFDLAFVDPPFASDLWRRALAGLEGHLADDAWLYLESSLEASADPAPIWRPYREGRTREVRFALYRRDPHGPPDALLHSAPSPNR